MHRKSLNEIHNKTIFSLEYALKAVVTEMGSKGKKASGFSRGDELMICPFARILSRCLDLIYTLSYQSYNAVDNI